MSAPDLSRERAAPRLRVLSLGAGVQSTALALMAAHGEVVPMPDVAIFADTGWEPRAVYEHLDWLETRLPFPVVRVRREGPGLGEHAINVAQGVTPRTGSSLPGFWLSPSGMTPFQCSKEFKTRVVGREIRRRLGLSSGERGPDHVVAEQWLGISAEERGRMKDNELKYVRNRWPLVDMNMRRGDCLRWMADHGYPAPPRSSCVFCPYRRDDEWRLLRETPEDWNRAVAFDEAIRAGYPGLVGQAFVHQSRRPLASVDLDAQRGLFEWGMQQECEGACGT